jgi:hypothetical protein
MAEKKESIEISYKANITDLKKKLESLPDITSEEAKKMVSALDRQLKQAERAAKRSSEASKKAARASAKAAREGRKDFMKLGQAAGVVAGAFAVMGTGIIQFSQELADLTNELTDASAKSGIAIETLAGLRLAAEGSGLEFSQLEGGLVKFQSSMLKASQGSKEMADSFGRLGIETKDANGELRDSDAVFNEAIKSLGAMENQTERNAIAMQVFGKEGGAGLIQSGALENLQSMTEFAKEFGVAIDKDAVDAMGNFQRKMAEFDAVSQGTFQRLMSSITGTDQGITRGIELATDAMVFFGSIATTNLDYMRENFQNLFTAAKAVQMVLSDDMDGAFLLLQKRQEDFVKVQDKWLNQFDVASERVKRAHELSAEALTQSEKEAGEAKKKADEEERRKNAIKAALKAQKEFVKLQANIRKETRDLVDLVEERGTSAYQKQVDAIKEIGIAIEDQLGLLTAEKDWLDQIAESRELSTKEALTLKSLTLQIGELEAAQAANRLQEGEELKALYMDQHNTRMESIDKEREAQEKAAKEVAKATRDLHMETLSAMGNTFDASSQLVEEFMSLNKSSTMEAFRAQQALSIGSIIMKTAEGVMAAQSLPPPANIIQSAAVGVTGAAQLAKVASTPPPSFHMGGMAPDETMARLLKNEAVLDSGTVRRIGGEEGVKKLQRGEEVEDQTIVVKFPWKHIGRSFREVGYTKARKTGVRGY